MVGNGFLTHLTPFREGLDEWVGWWTGLVLSENLPLRDSVGFRPTSSLYPAGHPFPKRLIFNMVFIYDLVQTLSRNLSQTKRWYPDSSSLFEIGNLNS